MAMLNNQRISEVPAEKPSNSPSHVCCTSRCWSSFSLPCGIGGILDLKFWLGDPTGSCVFRGLSAKNRGLTNRIAGGSPTTSIFWWVFTTMLDGETMVKPPFFTSSPPSPLSTPRQYQRCAPGSFCAWRHSWQLPTTSEVIGGVQEVVPKKIRSR